MKRIICLTTLLGLSIALPACTPGGDAHSDSTTTAPVSQSGLKTAPVAGSAAPDFELPVLGKQDALSLSTLLAKGQPVVLNAFASWCGPCKAETSEFVKLSKQYAGRVQFVGVDMTKTEMSKNDVTAFVSQYQITYPVLLDSDGKFMDAYHIYGFPTTIIVFLSGNILKVVPQMMSTEQLEALLQQALKTS